MNIFYILFKKYFNLIFLFFINNFFIYIFFLKKKLFIKKIIYKNKKIKLKYFLNKYKKYSYFFIYWHFYLLKRDINSLFKKKIILKFFLRHLFKKTEQIAFFKIFTNFLKLIKKYKKLEISFFYTGRLLNQKRSRKKSYWFKRYKKEYNIIFTKWGVCNIVFN